MASCSSCWTAFRALACCSFLPSSASSCASSDQLTCLNVLLGNIVVPPLGSWVKQHQHNSLQNMGGLRYQIMVLPWFVCLVRGFLVSLEAPSVGGLRLRSGRMKT